MVVDRLSKAAHFIVLKYPYIAAGVAQIFLDNVFKVHGMPKSIILDRDVVFTSRKEFFKLQHVTLLTSTLTLLYRRD